MLLTARSGNAPHSLGWLLSAAAHPAMVSAKTMTRSDRLRFTLILRESAGWSSSIGRRYLVRHPICDAHQSLTSRKPDAFEDHFADRRWEPDVLLSMPPGQPV